MIFQHLHLKVGQKAVCEITKPRKSKVVVECTVDFNDGGFLHIGNNPLTYVKIIDNGVNGLSDSHMFSPNWEKILK